MGNIDDKLREVQIGHGRSQYFVDEDGNVYWQYQSRFKPMTHQTTQRGYRYVAVGGHRYLVHRLIAKAFIPNPDCKWQVNHLDENKLNNAASNLDWATHSENMKHYYRNKSYKLSGELNPNAKLTPEHVVEILTLLDEGKAATKIAKVYGVGHTTIYNIKLGKSYKRAAGISDE